MEVCPVRDIFVSNIGSIEILNSCARIAFYVERDGFREVVCKVVIPIENIPSAVTYTVSQLGGHWMSEPALPPLN